MTWRVETLDHSVVAEIAALPKKHQARYLRIVDLIEAVGLTDVGKPFVQKVHSKIWEIRVRADGGISRALFVAMTSQRIVIVRVFIKKTQKTPHRGIALAIQRARRAGLV
jgi:phage-related protein